MRKRNFLLTAGACLATLSLAVGSAMADPTSPAGPRDLAGTGSDTTQGVLNALSNVITIAGNKEIASYDAASTTNSATITTKGAAGSAPCTITRPSGSGAGINVLVADRTAGTHCLQFARSSTDDHTARGGSHLTYIPFATDAVSYAVLQTGSVSRNLSVATLKAIYNCDVTTGFKPLLPQSGSGTRKFFLNNILGLVDSPDYTSLHPCVSDIDPISGGTTPLLENTGNRLQVDATANPTAKQQIEPYAISSWIAQTANVVTDVHGRTLLGNIGGINSLTLNSAALGSRPVFNVLPNKLVADGPNSKTVFVGTSSGVCANTSIITQQGFATRSDCGSTSIQTDTSNGTDTVSPGE